MSSPILNVMTTAAIKAGKGMLRDFSEVDQLQVSRKGTANFVTQTDLRTEKLLVAELKKVRPDYGFLLEEGGEVKGRDGKHRWIIDPLDGTSNFIHAIPYFCISIGLEETVNGKSEIIAGVIFDPVHNELFLAEKGKGATVNNRKLAVTQRTSLEDTLLVTGGTGSKTGSSDERIAAFTSGGATIRHLGATALDLAYLAAGRIDACWHYAVKPWDIAAGMLLVAEAGGILTDMDGNPVTPYSQSLLGANKHLHAPMRKLLM